VSALGDQARQGASPTPQDADDERTARIERVKGEARHLEAATRLTELQAIKVAGEVARQPLQVRKLEAEIKREEAEGEALVSARWRAEVRLVVFLLIVVLILALALFSPAYLSAIGGGGALGVLVAAAARYGRVR